MKISFLFLLNIVAFSYLFSQPYPGWKNYTYNKNITGIEIQGNDLWISTQGGLVKYNKETGEKTFFNRANAGLPDNNLMGICYETNGNIWLATTYNGIAKFKDGQCTIYNTFNSELPSDQHNRRIIKDKNGNVWVASMNYMVKFNGTTWKTWETGHPFSSWPVISGFDIDSSGVVWIFSTDGIGKIENDEYSVISSIGSSLNAIIGCLKIDREQNIWIAIENQGIFKYDGSVFTRFNVSNSCITDNTIFDMTFDSQNKLWYSTSKGLVCFDGAICENYPSPEPLYKIKTDGGNAIWCGTLTGKLLYFDGSEYSYIDISNSPLNDNIIAELFVDGNNNKWISTRLNTCVKTEESFSVAFNTPAAAFANDKKGAAWIAFNTGENRLLQILPGDTTFFNAANLPFFQDIIINSMTVDKNNMLWISSNNGIYTFNGETFSNYNMSNSSIPSNYIDLLVFDQAGNLWGALNGVNISNGLCMFNGSEWTVWNTSNSAIPTDIVISLNVDLENKVWFSCMDEDRIVGSKEYGGGLTCFDGESMKTFTVYNSGLLANTVFDIYVDLKDKLWLSTSNTGLISFDKNNSWKTYNVTNSGIAHNWVQQIKQDKEGSLWLGHPGAGISVFKADTLTSSKLFLKTSSPVQVFPNPANDVLRVKMNYMPKNLLNIKIYDLSGRVNFVYPEQFTLCQNQELTLPIPDLLQNNQLYILQINCDSEQYSAKFIYRKKNP